MWSIAQEMPGAAGAWSPPNSHLRFLQQGSTEGMPGVLKELIIASGAALLLVGFESIADFHHACPHMQVLESIAIPVNLDDRESLLRAATT